MLAGLVGDSTGEMDRSASFAGMAGGGGLLLFPVCPALRAQCHDAATYPCLQRQRAGGLDHLLSSDFSFVGAGSTLRRRNTPRCHFFQHNSELNILHLPYDSH
jgi:hypothetical protein